MKKKINEYQKWMIEHWPQLLAAFSGFVALILLFKGFLWPLFLAAGGIGPAILKAGQKAQNKADEITEKTEQDIKTAIDDMDRRIAELDQEIKKEAEKLKGLTNAEIKKKILDRIDRS